jgi:hypothetical protein
VLKDDATAINEALTGVGNMGMLFHVKLHTNGVESYFEVSAIV